MDRIGAIVIVGKGPLWAQIGELFAKAGINVSMIGEEDDFTQQIARADLLLENVPGEMGQRERIFRMCAGAPPKIVFATTATWGITKLAAVSKRPSSFIGIHFTRNDATGAWLVEMAKGLETSRETVSACNELVQRAGAVCVESVDSPGLILDRVMACLINEAAYMYMTGIVSSIEDIDEIVRIRRRWARGPFQIADELGIDQVVETLEALSVELGSQYVPCRLLRQMAQAGRLGKKVGRGFYSYT